MILDKRIGNVPSKTAKQVINGKKECTKCHADKDIEEFYKSKHLLTGYSSECKECGRERKRLYTQERKELFGFFI